MTITPTQADREAYLSLNMVSPQDRAAIMSGDWDAVHGMQVIARHRLSTIEECAQTADIAAMQAEADPVAWAMGVSIATSIRSLSNTERGM